MPGGAERGAGSGRSAAQRPRWAPRARRRSGGGRGGGGGSCCGGSCALWPPWPCCWPAARPGAAVSAGPRRGAAAGPAEGGAAGPGLPLGVPCRGSLPGSAPGPCRVWAFAPGAAPGAVRNLAELGMRGGARPGRPGGPGGRGDRSGRSGRSAVPAGRDPPAGPGAAMVPRSGGPLPAAHRLRGGRSEAARVSLCRAVSGCGI